MHAPSVKRSIHISPDVLKKYVDRFLSGVHRLQSHIILMVFMILAFVFLLSLLNPPPDSLSPAVPYEHTALQPVGLQDHALTVFDDPRYAPEYGPRTRFLRDQLVTLTEATHADRVFVVVYGAGNSPFADGSQTNTFEVTWENGVPVFEVLQGHRQHGGPHMQDAYVQHYGLDIMNEHGRIVGYLEADYARDLSSFQEYELDLFTQTAGHVKAGLLDSLERVEVQENG